MIEQLASLLLPIEALLGHEGFDPQSTASPELVGLFRSMWFLCSLFHFAMFEEKDQIAMNWVRQVLGKIASKTPAIVVEEAMELVAELEYTTVIRREYAHAVCPSRVVVRLNIDGFQRRSPNTEVYWRNLYLSGLLRFGL